AAGVWVALAVGVFTLLCGAPAVDRRPGVRGRKHPRHHDRRLFRQARGRRWRLGGLSTLRPHLRAARTDHMGDPNHTARSGIAAAAHGATGDSRSVAPRDTGAATPLPARDAQSPAPVRQELTA